jgi:hypothetical protein
MECQTLPDAAGKEPKAWRREEGRMGALENDLLRLLPTADQARDKILQAKAQKLLAERKKQEKEIQEKKALIDRLQKGSGVSDAQALKKVTGIIQKAVSNGLAEVEVYRFPSRLCADRGVAINNQSPGWEDTLVGVPREMYEFWKRHLREKGYKLSCQIVTFPDGVLGDAALSLRWG